MKKLPNKLMNEIDASLIRNGVAIHARPLYALESVASALGIDGAIPVVDGDTREDVCRENLSAHVSSWFEARYGPRLKSKPGPGDVAVLLRGEAWRLRLPTIYGRVHFVFDRDINLDADREPFQIAEQGQELKHNIATSIDGISQDYLHELSDSELWNVGEWFVYSLNTLQGLRDSFRGSVLASAGFDDLAVAVDNLVDGRRSFGLSRWSSLQFVEKILKGVLTLRDVEFPKNHQLNDLADLLRNNGIAEVSRDHLDLVQCSAGVRYGEPIVGIEEAYRAHEASIRAVGALGSSGFSFG